MRFLHTADLHLGAPQHPEVYRKEALPSLFKLAKSLKVDFILVVGDIFDRAKPDQYVKDYLLKCLLDYEDVPVIFTVGNHDYTTKARKYHSLKYLSLLSPKLKNVYVYEEGVHLDVLGGKFDLCVLEDDLSIKGKLPHNPNQDMIVAWHGLIPGIDFKSNKSSESSRVFVDKVLGDASGQYLALGHIHKHMQVNRRCWYPGAFVQKTYGCEDGIVLVEIDEDGVLEDYFDAAYGDKKLAKDLGTKITTKSLHLDLPKKLNLSVTFEEGKDSEKDIVDFIKENTKKDSLVRLLFQLPMSTYASLDKEYIRKEVSEHVTELKLDNDAVQEKRIRKNAERMGNAKTLDEEFAITIETDDYGVEHVRLVKTCKRYYNA